MRPIYITGHKNPDTDSIVSSIAYAQYIKNKGKHAIASRIGPVSSDTEYLLNRFGFEDPLHIYTAKSTIREIDFDEAILIKKSMTIKEATDKLMKTDSKTLFVADEERNMLGIVTLNSVSKIWLGDERKLSKIIKTAKLNNIAKVLKAKVVVKPHTFELNGDIDLSPIQNADLEPGTIAITSNPSKIENAIKEQAGLIIVLDNIKLSNKTINEAKKQDVAIITSPLSAFNIAKLIYSTATVESIMEKAEKVTGLKDSMTTDEATNVIAKTRYRAYPIIDGHGKIIGSLSRYHLLNYEKKKLVLVDHNEKKQSIDDIEYGEVIEIVDHHRFGGFETTNPINITTQIVGATSTIIANKFIEEKIPMDKNLAGLLLGGIVADTMNFKSPTTTNVDIKVSKKLEEISGVDANELHDSLVKSSESIVNKKAIDICYDDFKEYDIRGNKVGLAQATCRSFDELKAIRTPLSQYLEEIIKTNGYDLFVVMLTDPNGSGSYLVYAGEKQNILEKAYPKMLANHFVNHLISRKKQLLPALIKEFEE